MIVNIHKSKRKSHSKLTDLLYLTLIQTYKEYIYINKLIKCPSSNFI